MTHVTPVVSLYEKNKMKKIESGPRTGTLMLIRHFARVYNYEPEHKQNEKKIFVN